MVLFHLSGAQAAVRHLRIAADPWCPINCDPAAAPYGIGVDLAKAVYEPLGYTVDYLAMPWSRALEEAHAERIDAVIGANHEDDPNLVFPRHAVLTVSDGFYARIDRPVAYRGIDSLTHYRLGAIKDYGYNEALAAYVASARHRDGAVQEVGGEDALDQNIHKLMADRIDLIVETQAVMDYRLKNLGLAGSIHAVGHMPPETIYLAFPPESPQSQALADAYDKGIGRLEKSGELPALYHRYGLTP